MQPMALEDGCSCNYQKDTHHAELSRKVLNQESQIHADRVQVYWNLDGFQNPDDPTVNNYTVHLPYSGQRVAVDGILIPNGTILPNEQGGVFDFWSSPKKLGANLTSPDLVGGCGSGCVGYDTCWLVNREQNGPYDWRQAGPVATVSSPFSGIQIDIFSDQQAFQIYTCPGQNGMSYPVYGK
jgi:aldose 1-epimerase